MLTLISCTGLGARRVLPRDLPAAPSWAVPVDVARPAVGTDLVEVAKREQQARKANAQRLRLFRDWYDERREEYSAP